MAYIQMAKKAPIIVEHKSPFANSDISGLAKRALDSAGDQAAWAQLLSELEKVDPTLHDPLTTIDYADNIPVKMGGGWAEIISAQFTDYGATGNSEGYGSGTGNAIPIIQANVTKNLYKTHDFDMILRTSVKDDLKSDKIRRSLAEIYMRGIRLAYEKHKDQTVFVGSTDYGTTGLLNNSGVASQGAGAAWSTLTPVQILAEINDYIGQQWAAVGYDKSAIANRILLPNEQYAYIATTPVSQQFPNESILEYLEKHALSTVKGSPLKFGNSMFGAGAGASGADRAVVYRNDPYFLVFEILVELSRLRTAVLTTANEAFYSAHLSEVEIFYPQSLLYVDGI